MGILDFFLNEIDKVKREREKKLASPVQCRN